MSFWKKSLIVAGAAVAMLGTPVLAELKVTPYGAAQYRLRFEHNSYSYADDAEAWKDGRGTFDYSNRLCLRMGMRVKFDDQFSMQFQVGNDWGAAENVQWSSNRNGSTLYAHLAFFRWDQGAFFLEAGIVPISSNGALDFFERSLNVARPAAQTPENAGAAAGWPGNFGEAPFNGWGDQNNSLAGIKLGVPIIKEGVKVSAELTQSVINARTQSPTTVDHDNKPLDRPSAIMTVLQVPVNAGDFRITPEFAAIFNREIRDNNNGRPATEEDAAVPATEIWVDDDMELGFGAAGSYKINDDITVTFRGGYAMYNNENTNNGNMTRDISGLLVGAGVTVNKVGPGNIQFAVDYSSVDNAAVENGSAKIDYLYTDLRYVMRLHPRVTFTPRYRTYTRMLNPPEGATGSSSLETRFGNRFELIVEGSF